MSVRNAISSGHNILSTIHADKASSIPLRMYSLMESSQDVEQFLNTIHRYVQVGVYVKGYFSKKFNRFQREIIEVCEFYVDENNKPCTNEIYKKALDGHYSLKNPTQHLLDYLSIQNVFLDKDTFHIGNNSEYDGDIEEDLKKYHEEEAAAKTSNTSVSSADINSESANNQVNNAPSQNQNIANQLASNTPNNVISNTQATPVLDQVSNLNGVGIANNINLNNSLNQMQTSSTNLNNNPASLGNDIFASQTVAENPVSQVNNASNVNDAFNSQSITNNEITANNGSTTGNNANSSFNGSVTGNISNPNPSSQEEVL